MATQKQAACKGYNIQVMKGMFTNKLKAIQSLGYRNI